MSGPDPRPPPACSAHRALVEAALGPDPSDETLEAYAEAVPGCAACRRALAARLAERDGDGVVRIGPPGPRDAEPGEGVEGVGDPLPALAGAPSPPPLSLDLRKVACSWLFPIGGSYPRGRAEGEGSKLPVPRGRAVAPVLLLAAAAALAWILTPPAADRPERAAPAPVGPAVAVPLPAAPRPGSPAPEVPPRSERPGAAPLALPDPPRAPELARAPDPPLTDDWLAPPWVDLRGAQAKGADPVVRSVRLELTGGHRALVPGDRVGLEVVASHETPLAVCVDGPERGVVWRGAVPAGRTPLSRGGRAQAFAFAAAGTYTFRVALDPDAPGCEPAAHRVDVAVEAGR